MKNIFKLIAIFTLGLFIVSCEDEDKNPFDVAALDNGAVLRTIAIPNPTIDLFDVENSSFSVEVEFFAGGETANNSLLESVDVFVRFRDNTAFNGTNDVEEVPFGNIPASAFQTGPSGFPRTTITVGADEALDALGLSTSQVDGGDIIAVRLALKLTTGQVFSSENRSGDVPGAFFAAPFAYDAAFVCDLPSTIFVGQYQMTLLSSNGPLGRPFADGVVTISASSGTQRTTTPVCYLPGIGCFNGPIAFNLVCGRTVAPNQASGGGVGCGGGAIRMETQTEFGTFDANDDSSFTLIFNDFVADGGCGISTPLRVELRFDKIQ